MNANNRKPRTPQATLADLNIVTPELSYKISSAASIGVHAIRESFIYRNSTSRAEFAAACEMAENLGLAVQ